MELKVTICPVPLRSGAAMMSKCSAARGGKRALRGSLMLGKFGEKGFGGARLRGWIELVIVVHRPLPRCCIKHILTPKFVN